MLMTSQQIWDLFHASLTKFVQRRVADPDAVEDVVQDIFLKIHTRMHTLRTIDSLPSWVYRIAQNAVIDYYRQQRPHDALPVDLEVEHEERDEVQQVLSSCASALLQQLSASSREALTLTDVEGMTQQAFAHRLGLSPSGAKSRVQRARAQLKALLLACCHLQFDQRGQPMDYQPREPTCAPCTCGPRDEVASRSS